MPDFSIYDDDTIIIDHREFHTTGGAWFTKNRHFADDGAEAGTVALGDYLMIGSLGLVERKSWTDVDACTSWLGPGIARLKNQLNRMSWMTKNRGYRCLLALESDPTDAILELLEDHPDILMAHGTRGFMQSIAHAFLLLHRAPGGFGREDRVDALKEG